MNIVCSECRQIVHRPLLAHYREHHPKLYRWAVRLNVRMAKRKA